MDVESVLIITSLLGLGMAPFWAKWATGTLARFNLSPLARTSCVVVLSVLAMLISFVGPWVIMAHVRGLLWHNLADPTTPYIATVFFGPGVALQVWLAICASRSARRRSGR